MTTPWREFGATRRELIAVPIMGTIAVAVAHLADQKTRVAYHLKGYEGTTLERVMKLPGELPIWIALSVVFIALDSRGPVAAPLRDRFSRAATLMLATISAGLLAEGLKMVIRRVRPELVADTMYAFRPWSDQPFSTSGLGMPSSHAAVAFGAYFILARTSPRIAIAAGLAALTCATARVLAGAHYLSDVVAAAPVAWVCATVVWWAHLRTLGSKKEA